MSTCQYIRNIIPYDYVMEIIRYDVVFDQYRQIRIRRIYDKKPVPAAGDEYNTLYDAEVP